LQVHRILPSKPTTWSEIMATGRTSGSANTIWVIIAGACLVFGAILGFVIARGTPSPQLAGSAPVLPPSGAPATPTPALVDERQLQALRGIVARDPRNAQAAIELGNMLYDAGRYREAIPLYQQAFALQPTSVEVSTDLGTALWYSGRADEALAQYSKSLSIDPTHAQTLFNIGIVTLDGKHDAVGAIAAWQRLLETNPDYPDKAKVQELMARARQAAMPAPSTPR
jgi:cytochrome c-type biogenesis protein CcmH/NrfG